MAGPQTEEEAILGAQDAIRRGRYWVTDHWNDRSEERRITLDDMKHLINNPTSCVEYKDGRVTTGGTCWRLTGLDLDGNSSSIGIEICRDHLGNQLVAITIF